MPDPSISELSKRIREQSVSPVDVVQGCLERIDGLNPALNAFITVMAESAREDATKAHAEVRAGHWRGPLHGVPVAVKDFYDTAGVRTTAGFDAFKARVPDTDAEVVTRLRRAGAVVVGKTNMDALGMATTGLTSWFGPVRNPVNPDYLAGGSSAGSAAAVAAGLCCATIDTDAVGSVRLPAACCGVVGFKGTFGLISLDGILGDQPTDGFIRWMGHAGVTARSAQDVALMVNALADRVDDVMTDLGNDNRNVRLGVGDNYSADPEVQRALDSAVTALRSAGYDPRDAHVPFGDSRQGDMATIVADRAAIAEQAFRDVDVIVLPTVGSMVPTVREAAKNPEQGLSAELTAFANYYGLPAVSIPCGIDRNQMPIGLQIVGRPGGDRTVLGVAHQCELLADRSARPPIS